MPSIFHPKCDFQLKDVDKNNFWGGDGGKDKKKWTWRGKEYCPQACSISLLVAVPTWQVDASIYTLPTFTALFISCQLIARLTGAFVAAQCVLTVLFTPTVVWLRTFIHFCQEETRTSHAFPTSQIPSCSSGNACSRRTRALVNKQSRYGSRHHKYKRTPYYQTLKGLLLQLLATGTKGAYSRQKQKKWSLVKTSLYCILIC